MANVSVPVIWNASVHVMLSPSASLTNEFKSTVEEEQRLRRNAFEFSGLSCQTRYVRSTESVFCKRSDCYGDLILLGK